MAGRRRIPPARTCQDCGKTWRAWGGVLCPACVRLVAAGREGAESLRDYRRRVIDPERNAT